MTDSAVLLQLPDDPSEAGRVTPVQGSADSDIGSDHPMRRVTRQVAYEGGWSPDRARKVTDLFDSMAAEWDALRSGGQRNAPVVDALAAKGILAGVPLSRLFPDRADVRNDLLVAVTETVTEEDIAALAAGLKEALA